MKEPVKLNGIAPEDTELRYRSVHTWKAGTRRYIKSRIHKQYRQAAKLDIKESV